MKKIYLLCTLSVSALLSKEIQVPSDRSLFDRCMLASTRIIPTINPMRMAQGMSPYAAAYLYIIYTTATEKVTQLPLWGASKIKNIIGGIDKKEPRVKEQPKMCDSGISGLMKPFGKIISIDTEGTLFKISVMTLFKDSMIQDAQDLKKWCGTQARIMREELTSSYIIPEKTPLSVKERAIYLYHLLHNTICRCSDPINVEVLKEMTDGCTAEDLEKVVYRCAHIDQQVLNQVAAYYAGMTLAHALLDGENYTRTCIYPVAHDHKVFGKIHAHESHVLEKTTIRSLKEKGMIALAGKVAAELNELELSSIFTQEVDAKVKDCLRACMCSEQRLEEERQKLETEIKMMLESYRPQLEKITQKLKNNWEITADEVEEILASSH